MIDKRTAPVKELIEQLIRARKEAGILQGDLAGQLQISQATMSHWENGFRLPELDKFAAWAAVLDRELSVGMSDRRKISLEELARRHPGEFEALMLAEKYRQGGEASC